MPNAFPMPPHLKRARAPRDRFLRAVLVALALAQLVAIWMLCAHQVRKGQMRDISLQVQRVAIADCLRYVPRATLDSCAGHVDAANRRDGNAVVMGGKQAGQDAQRASISSAAQVGASYR